MKISNILQQHHVSPQQRSQFVGDAAAVTHQRNQTGPTNTQKHESTHSRLSRAHTHTHTHIKLGTVQLSAFVGYSLSKRWCEITDLHKHSGVTVRKSHHELKAQTSDTHTLSVRTAEGLSQREPG